MLLGVGEQEHVIPGGLGVEIDPRLPRETDPLNERTVLVPDQEHEGATRPGVVELDVDLACGAREVHLEPYRREGVEDEEFREVGEGEGHTVPRAFPRKALSRTRGRPA